MSNPSATTAPVKRGTDEPLLQYWESSASIQNGAQTTMEWKGISLAKMSAKANQYAAAGWDGKLRYEYDVATLTLSRTGSAGNPGGITTPFSDITDKWEVAVEQERPELFENATFLSLVQANDDVGITGYNLRSVQIIAAMRAKTVWKDFYAALQNPLKAANGETDIAGSHLSAGINLLGTAPNLKLFYDDYARGATNFLRGKYALRHTTSAPSTYASNVADFNVEKIYSISQLLSECQSTGLWIMPLPGYLAYKILSYPVPATMPANYTWGALKCRASAVTAARGRIEITTEYIIDGWPIHTYGLKT
jgi:hypothetical protein